MKLKKNQQKLLDYIQNVSPLFSAKEVAEKLGISREAVGDNLRALDEMNVIERVRKGFLTLHLVNSPEDWQVYYANKMEGKVNNKNGVNQFCQ